MKTATSLKQNHFYTSVVDKLFSKSQLSSPVRSVKKENAPPPRDAEIISVSSSEAPTIISVSSASAVSLSSSVIDITPIEIKDESKLDVGNLAASPRARKRSPRLQERPNVYYPLSKCKRERSSQSISSLRSSQPKKKKAEPKRKRIASDDEEVVNLDDVEEVICVIAAPSPKKVTAKAPAINVRSAIFLV